MVKFTFTLTLTFILSFPLNGHSVLRYDTNITDHGITWTFTENEPVGQFVNGDYYVVGPVTIIAIDPSPANDRNGSVMNLPIDQGRSGYDSRVSSGRYDPSMRAQLPIELNPGDALISTISMESINAFRPWLSPHEGGVSPVKSASVLTCLAEAVTDDAFRPSYCDRQQIIYYAGDINWSLLPDLPLVDDVPAYFEWAGHFRRPWLDVCFFGFDAAAEYQPQYGREVGRAVGIASLMCMLDVPRNQKEPLLYGLIQYGIDLWGIAKAGYTGWQAHGGHGSGRKWPIIFAGIMLGDDEMQSPNAAFPELNFGEDMQTMYDQCWTGADVVYAGHVGPDGNEFRDGWGPYEHLHPSEWYDNLGEGYRRCCTSLCWVGQALAARIMNAMEYWDHPAFFDYVDRWMTEDDSEAVQIILQTRGWDYTMDWARQGQCWDEFVENMWDIYRYEAYAVEKLSDDFGLQISDFQNIIRDEIQFSLNIKHTCNVKIEIFNIEGGLVKTCSRYYPSKGSNVQSLSLEGLSKGIYTMKVSANSHEKYLKMISLY